MVSLPPEACSLIFLLTWCPGMDINAAVPSQAMGQTYVFVTSQDEKGTLTAADIKYGPAVLEVNPPPPSIDYSIMKE